MGHRQPNDVGAVTGLHWSGRVSMAALSAFAVASAFAGWLLTRRPPMWSLAWWGPGIGAALGFVLTFSAFWRVYVTVPWLPWAFLALDGLAVILFWSDPDSPFGPLLLLLLSAVVAARFRKWFLMAHVWILAVALAGAWYLGADASAAVPGLGAQRRDRGYPGHLPALPRAGDPDRPPAAADGAAAGAEGARGAGRGGGGRAPHRARTNSRTGVVLLLDEEAQVLRPHFLYSEPPLSPEEKEAVMNTTIEVGVGLSGWVASTDSPSSPTTRPGIPGAADVPGTPHEDESILVVPLIADGRLYGVLRVDRPGRGSVHHRRPAPPGTHGRPRLRCHLPRQLEERLARRDALTASTTGTTSTSGRSTRCGKCARSRCC